MMASPNLKGDKASQRCDGMRKCELQGRRARGEFKYQRRDEERPMSVTNQE